MSKRESNKNKLSAVRARNKKNHDNMPARTKNSKSGQFNDFRFSGLDWWKENISKSSSYIHMNRVSEDGNKIVVRVADSHINPTKYGYALQLDSNNVQYLKNWQVLSHTEMYKGADGFEVVLDRSYFKPTATKQTNSNFSDNAKALNFDYWKRAALEQDKKGNTVSIRS